jgi:hypothetical protein
MTETNGARCKRERNKTKTFTDMMWVRLKPETLVAIDRMAAARKTYRSKLVRELLEAELRRATADRARDPRRVAVSASA